MVHIGIDPGKNGAVAVIWPHSEVTVYDLTGSPDDDASIFHAIIRANGGHVRGLHVTMERVTAMPSDDDPTPDRGNRRRRGMGATSAFNFGHTCGMLEGMLAALQLPYTLVTPVKWRNAIHGKGAGKGLSRDERKTASRRLAMQLYPHLAGQLARVKDADRAEAVLLARYGLTMDTSSLTLTP